MNAELTTLLDPQLLILVAVLYFVGEFVKRTGVNNRFIPIILPLTGIALSIVYYVSINSAHNIPKEAFDGITQGILAAGLAVYANQFYNKLIVRNDDIVEDDKTSEK